MSVHRQLRDSRGRFIAHVCPLCGGQLYFEESKIFWGDWVCYELVDPEDDDKPLAACPFQIPVDEPLDKYSKLFTAPA